MHLFERLVLRVIGENSSADIKTTRLMLRDYIAPMQMELVSRGWVLTAKRMRIARWLPLWIALMAPAVGIIKLIIGLMRDRPVGYLSVGLVIAMILALAFFARQP